MPFPRSDYCRKGKSILGSCNFLDKSSKCKDVFYVLRELIVIEIMCYENIGANHGAVQSIELMVKFNHFLLKDHIQAQKVSLSG